MKYRFIGYARESLNNENLEYQVNKLKEFGCTKIYAEIKRANSNKNILKSVSNNIKPGDVFVICSLDRIGGTILFIIKLLQYFKNNNIEFISLKEKINTIEDKYFYTTINLLSDCDKNLIIDKTVTGLQLVSEKFKRKGGRKKDLSPEKKKLAIKIKKLYFEEKLSVREIKEKLKIGISTVYKCLRAMDVDI